MLGSIADFHSGHRSQRADDTNASPIGSYPTLLSCFPSISMVATKFQRNLGRVIVLSQCELLMSAGVKHSQVTVWYGMKKVLTKPSWLLTAVMLVNTQVV